MLRPFKGRISQKIPTGHNLFAMPSIFSAIDDDDKNHDCNDRNDENLLSLHFSAIH